MEQIAPELVAGQPECKHCGQYVELRPHPTTGEQTWKHTSGRWSCDDYWHFADGEE